MSRLIGLLVLTLALLQGTGLDARLGELACADEHHENEGPASDCPPECATCPCCARVTFPPLAQAQLLAAPTQVLTSPADGGSGFLPTAPPREILHVPLMTA